MIGRIEGLTPTGAFSIGLTIGILLVAGLHLAVHLWDAIVAWRERRHWRRVNEEAARRNPADWPPQHFNCRCTVTPRNASPHALPGETEADTIERLLKEARDK